ncbi:MAG: hypothetical protein FJZ64_02255 [Chlamydiae bacterium]|nr:hypothetical protein [Chlamydiota bacterium]
MEIEAIDLSSGPSDFQQVLEFDGKVEEFASRRFQLISEGAPTLTSKSWTIREESRVLKIEGHELPHGRIGGTNGVGTYYEEALGYAHNLNKYSEGCRIEWVYNCPYTAIADIVAHYLLKVSAPEKFLQTHWNQFHEDYKDNPEAKYLQICHSQGAVHVKNALLHMPKEIRNRIIVVAISPAAIVPKSLCFASYNYASKRDVVPYSETFAHALLNPLQAIQNIKHYDELVFLDPHPDAPPLDHILSSPTFTPVVQHHIQEFVREYGAKNEIAS